jgi:hypothetical protein
MLGQASRPCNEAASAPALEADGAHDSWRLDLRVLPKGSAVSSVRLAELEPCGALPAS